MAPSEAPFTSSMRSSSRRISSSAMRSTSSARNRRCSPRAGESTPMQRTWHAPDSCQETVEGSHRIRSCQRIGRCWDRSSRWRIAVKRCTPGRWRGRTGPGRRKRSHRGCRCRDPSSLARRWRSCHRRCPSCSARRPRRSGCIRRCSRNRRSRSCSRTACAASNCSPAAAPMPTCSRRRPAPSRGSRCSSCSRRRLRSPPKRPRRLRLGWAWAPHKQSPRAQPRRRRQTPRPLSWPVG